jgi:hypothetical protein
LDLLGGEPVWQVLHALPFAIWGVAFALDIVSEFTASVRKNIITVPITYPSEERRVHWRTTIMQ